MTIRTTVHIIHIIYIILYCTKFTLRTTVHNVNFHCTASTVLPWSHFRPSSLLYKKISLSNKDLSWEQNHGQRRNHYCASAKHDFSIFIFRTWHKPKTNTKKNKTSFIILINFFLQSAAYMTKTWNRWVLYGLSMFLRTNAQQVWWTKNVSQLLFDGFENPIQQISTYIPGYDGPDKFGYMYGVSI